MLGHPATHCMLSLPFVSLQARQVRAMLEKSGASFSTDDTAKEPVSTIVQNHH